MAKKIEKNREKYTEKNLRISLKSGTAADGKRERGRRGIEREKKNEMEESN